MRTRGFTLIEVLVSLLILAVMAATAFKGVDSITRAREVAEGNLQRILRLQSVMTQWDIDMASVADTLNLPGGAFEFDGARLRLTRTTTGGVQVVVWALRNGHWERWAGPATTQVGELEVQWRKSYQLRDSEPGTLVALKGAAQWQVYCYRKFAGQRGEWSNCQSSASSSAAATRQLVPQGIRSVLTLGPDSGFTGVITRDVALAPQPN
ncbi:MAG: prepilin-type N-terminal cleavage/methylation domain-containing protein [Burkholderiales bacterium]|nr:prepilin-type N-terminal cleavage/methylation domain-containing protein [Burkholderiales bacterium]